MSVEITEAFKRQYGKSFELVHQQRMSLLSPYARQESQEAELKMWDYIGETTVQWDLPRHSDSPQIDTPHSVRANRLHSAEWGDLVDDDDQLQALGSPASQYIQSAVAAMNRAKDERIIEAVWATVLTGKNADVSVAYSTECSSLNGDGTVNSPGTAVSATTDTGLTLAKIAKVGTLMDDAGVPQTGRVLFANTNQKWYLLGSTKATSGDYATVRALTRGEINEYLGFTFVWLPSDRFTTNTTDTGTLQCGAFHRDSILLATARDIETRLTERSDKRFSVYAYAKMRIGATRLDGAGVVPILLDAEVAPDFSQS